MRNIVFTPSPKIEIRSAGAKGRGVFAVGNLKRGELIETAPTLLIPKNEAADFLKTFMAHYIFKTDTGGRFVVGLGFTSLFNHSDKPSADFSATQTHIKIKAKRAIAAGTEITLDYGWTAAEWRRIGGVIS